MGCTLSRWRGEGKRCNIGTDKHVGHPEVKRDSIWIEWRWCLHYATALDQTFRFMELINNDDGVVLLPSPSLSSVRYVNRMAPRDYLPIVRIWIEAVLAKNPLAGNCITIILRSESGRTVGFLSKTQLDFKHWSKFDWMCNNPHMWPTR